MKKRLFQLLLLGALVTCFSIAPAQALPFTTLNVLDSYIETGEVFNVEVSVDGDGIGMDLVAFGFDVDPSSLLSLVTYTGYTLGPGFSDDSAGPNNVAGSSWGISDNNILLATLSFAAGPVAGNDTLEIEGLFADFLGLYYTDGFQDYDGNIIASTSLTVNPSSSVPPVPEPGTIIILLSNLAAVAGFGNVLKKDKL